MAEKCLSRSERFTHLGELCWMRVSEDVKAIAARRLDTDRTKKGPNFRPSSA
jgi:hypothetical protein